MFSRIRWALWGWLLASAALVAGPADARAAWLRFRNDLGHAVVVQSSWTSGGKAYRSKPHYLHPGESVSEWIGSAHPRQIFIADARPPRKTLLEIEAKPGKNDRSYAIQSVKKPGSKDAVLQATLLPSEAGESARVASQEQSKSPSNPKTGMTAKQSK